MKWHGWTAIFLLYILMQINMLWELEACGQLQIHSGLQIANGSDTHRWPWHAAIYHQVNETDFIYRCGGTLVSSTFILTAAHCVSLAVERVAVSLGRLHLNASQSSAPLIKVTKILAHSNYRPENFENDIAIVTLSTNAIFNSNVQPICMWKSDRMSLSEVIGKYGTVVGWGITENGETPNVLQEASFPVVSSISCLMSNRDLYGRLITDSNFCAGTRNGTSVCTGDSGGSITFQEDDRFYIRGIVSVGANKLDRNTNTFMCDTMQYALFTDVAQYLPWIAEVTEITEPIECETVVQCDQNTNVFICKLTLTKTELERKCKIIFNDALSLIINQVEVMGDGSTAVPDLSSAVDEFENLQIVKLISFELLERSTLAPFRQISDLTVGIARLDADMFADLNSLESLWIINNNLTTLPPGIFHNNNQIRTLGLRDNRFTWLHPDLFEKLPNVEVLVLYGSKLETLPANIFRNNEKMLELKIVRNQLKEIHVDLFNGLADLSVLDLHSNLIEIIPPGLFRGNSKLTDVRLANNKIKQIGIDLLTMLQLISIKLSGNHCIDEDFDFSEQSRGEANEKIRRAC